MSRTYRRKKAVIPEWILNDNVVSEEWEIKYYNPWREKTVRVKRKLWADVPRTGNDLKEHLANYYSDCFPVDTPNKDFRKGLNRERRSKGNAETRRVWKQGDYENGSFDPWKKDVYWWYW